MSDPRVFFAAERTLLAWIRTGITLMGLGFVVARFGLFLNIMARSHDQPPALVLNPSTSGGLGVLLIGVGAVTIAWAAIQHRTFVRSLPPNDLPPGYRRSFGLVNAAIITLVGLALTMYVNAEL